METNTQPTQQCFCPDDCNCRSPWRTNYCGCKAHAERKAAHDSGVLIAHAHMRRGAHYCPSCGTDEAMPGHEC